MNQKLKSLLYFGAFLMAIALYEMTSPEQPLENTADQQEFSKLKISELDSAETAEIQFNQ